MTEAIYNPQKLTEELKAEGLPVAGVSSSGRVDYSRELTASEIKSSQAVISAHDPAPKTKDLRIQAYLDAGITLEALVFALWDQIIKEDGSAAAGLQAKMETINSGIN
jgi:hypothetical protein